MQFWIADSFTDSLARLTNTEQKAVKTTAFDLQTNPAAPGLKFHKLDRARDRNFWSVRVNADLRIIVHRSASGLLLCYVDHHDKAYHWANSRKLEVHPQTGAAQLVEVRERIEEVVVPVYVKSAPTERPLFAEIAYAELLGYGVPADWLAEVRQVGNEDELLQLVDHLPEEAAEALLSLAVGETPTTTPTPAGRDDPFDHPDARRRFRVMTDFAELEQALSYPWEKWAVFLHPEQARTVEKDYNGPARVSGSAGTGKTIVALHRAVYLARSNPESRVLLTTFSPPLAAVLRNKLRCLIGNQPRLAERLEVMDLLAFGRRLYRLHGSDARIVTREELEKIIDLAGKAVVGHGFSNRFLLDEWCSVVDAWQLQSWESYRKVRRLGRKTRLPESRRRQLWEIFSRVRNELEKSGLMTEAGMFSWLSNHFQGVEKCPFDYFVVDEAQDIGVSQLRFLAVMAGRRKNGLFFAGDLGQRIFQPPFSWKSLGVDIRGRSRTLRINYRTSHQIRRQADRLLASELADVDGNLEKRDTTISLFNGPEPEIRICADKDEEIEEVATWLRELSTFGVPAGEIGVFVRSEAELLRASAAVGRAGLTFRRLDEKMELKSPAVSIAVMHLVKGLEFRAVVVMACDDEVLPSLERLASVADDADLEEVYNTERHLLYVACTRARDYLLISGVDPVSEFIDDMSDG
jgi:superfamily I DNA/RNA helicase/mRNA-degrading endonuclease RelE of RelBE toxin-antitoxin system